MCEREQEITLLQIKEIAYLNSTGTDFKLQEVMSLPVALKGLMLWVDQKKIINDKTVSFDVLTFDQLVYQIEKLAKAGVKINPEDFYSPVKTHKGKLRDLPMVDSGF